MHTPETSLRIVLSKALGLLKKHRGTLFLLSLLGMPLAALGPALQLHFHLPEDPMVVLALAFAAKLPLEMYLIPRLVARADAEERNSPENPTETWKEAFEARWLRVFLAKLALFALAGVGVGLLIFPGLLVILAFGWLPLRMLLRGENAFAAARGSASLLRIARSWLPCALFLLALYGLAALGLGATLQRLAPDPGLQDVSAWMRLRHPAHWVAHFLGTSLEVALSLGLLALYQGIEVVSRPVASPGGPDPG